MPEGIKKRVLKSVGGAMQGKFIEWLRGLIYGGVSGGSRIIAGPDAGAELRIADFDRSFATIISLGANFVVNGVAVGMVVFAKRKPVLTTADLVYAKAFGVMGGVGLATSLDVEASGLVYQVNVG